VKKAGVEGIRKPSVNGQNAVYRIDSRILNRISISPAIIVGFGSATGMDSTTRSRR